MSRVLNPLRFVLPAMQQMFNSPTVNTPGVSEKKDIVGFVGLKKPLAHPLSAFQPHSLQTHPPLPQVIRP